MTRTTWAALTPAGTWHVAADGVGEGRGDGFGAGRLEGRGFVLDLVAEGRCVAFGVARVVDGGRAVVVRGGAVVVVVAVDVGLGGVVAGAASCWSDPQPAARRPSAVAAATTAAVRARVPTRFGTPLIGRSAGGRGCSTGRPSAAPAR
ncbi:hypothetical protein GCM10025782_04720 [Pedococcus ginsenosidimutans]|uniref:Uncharacterized protein n=1 Tax=Pedococcus ginsenosidimutans TaxID=490570 RepID=A0ABP8XQF5_9MICO